MTSQQVYTLLQSDSFQGRLKELLKEHKQDVGDLIPIRIYITHKHGKPAINCKMNTSSDEIVKLLFSSAYHKYPIIMAPIFSDHIKAISNALEKGLLYRDGRGNYRWTF